MTVIDAPQRRVPVFTVGERIRKARTDAGMTAAELADALGVARETVARWETSARPPRADRLAAIEDVCGIVRGWLTATLRYTRRAWWGLVRAVAA